MRRYLLAGLLVCRRCGRRLESTWSNGRPAYRCSHGYTSATVPDPVRPKKTYVPEDQILPHLAGLAILRAGDGTPDHARQAGITAPAEIADLIDQLRITGAVLTYDSDTRTIRAADHSAATVTVGQRG